MSITQILLILLFTTYSLSIQCGIGGVICPSGTCHYPTYIQGCSVYSSSTTCDQCEYNYIKSGNLCTYSPPKNESTCCKAFIYPSGQCSQCVNGLYLINGQCKQRKIAGCLAKSSTGSCINCALQYVILGGMCIKKVEGCSSYLGDGSCQACNLNYTLSGSICILRNGKNQTLSGCKNEFDFGCAECSEGYRLLPNGTCLLGLIEGCLKYMNDGSCQVCKKSVYSLRNGACFSYGCTSVNQKGQCIQCDSNKGFSLGSDGFCQLPGCLVSSQNSCLICQSGYTQTENGCKSSIPTKQCTVCAKNYFLNTNGECIAHQPGCLIYKGSKCSECQQKYYLSPNSDCLIKQIGCIYNNGICSVCKSPFKNVNSKCVIEGCGNYSSTECISCLNPYVLLSGFCTYPNCNQVIQGKCISCYPRYASNHEGFCYLVDPLCKAYDFSGICIECNLGYYLDNTKSPICKQQLFGCNYVDRKCVSCRAPFSYNSTNQSCSIDGCLTYFLGGCQSCSAGYDLRYNFCKLPNCLVSNKGHCAECDPDYILRSDGLCVNKDEFCWKYDEKGFCSQCATNYYMSKLNQKCKMKQPGCQYNEKDECYACQLPFYFDGVRCQIYGCLELSTKGCKQCFYPMQVTTGNICKVINCDRMQQDKCISCKPGYHITQDGSCQVDDPKCLVYGGKVCSKCVKGYRVDKNGICQYADEHCWDFSELGHCTNCDRLYFLNQFNKCEIKDSTCSAYSGGRCIQCKTSYYLYSGLCYPNAKGCISQKDIKTCEKCQSGYNMNSGTCTPAVTKLSWDDIDMDFWSGSSETQVKTSAEVFTVGKTNKYNLDGAISKSNAKIIYSSIATNRNCFQVDDNSDINGWSPSGNGSQWVGVLLGKLETFYALDLKYVNGNSFKNFTIEESNDGIVWRKVTQLSVTKMIIGTVETFYFTPVQSKAIRIVISSGSPNIKFQFYYSNGENQYQQNQTSTTWIQEQTSSTIIDSLKGEQFSTGQSCTDKAMCWMGIQLCDVGNIKSFTLTPQQGSNGTISTVTVKYSRDGVNFECYQSCQQITLAAGKGYQFVPVVTATKLRIYPAQWTGTPACSVTFEY